MTDFDTLYLGFVIGGMVTFGMTLFIVSRIAR